MKNQRGALNSLLTIFLWTLLLIGLTGCLIMPLFLLGWWWTSWAGFAPPIPTVNPLVAYATVVFGGALFGVGLTNLWD